MKGHGGLLRERFPLLAQYGVLGMSRGFTPGHDQMAGNLGFTMQFNAETLWHFSGSAFLGLNSSCTDAGAALAPLSSRGTRVTYWQSSRRLRPDSWRLQLPLDDCCRLVLLCHAVLSMRQTEEIPVTFPGWGRKVLLISILPLLHRYQNYDSTSIRIIYFALIRSS